LTWPNCIDIGDFMSSEDNGYDQERRPQKEGLATEREKIELPRRYKVLIHNDDYTTMDFVVMILQRVFHRHREEAEAIMLKVHKEGMAVCGIYTFEIAESKVDKAVRMARDGGHPLKCTMEME